MTSKPRNPCKCPRCGKLTTEPQRHHIIYRSQGGCDDPQNCLDVCRECHVEIHRNDWKVWGKRGGETTQSRIESRIKALANLKQFTHYTPDQLRGYVYARVLVTL